MKHFRSPKVESDTLVDSGIFRQSPSAYFAPSPREQFRLRSTRCGHLDYQGAIRTGIEPALSEYKSAVYQNEPLIAVDTFIYFSRHHFKGGTWTHNLLIRNQALYQFATIQLLLVPLLANFHPAASSHNVWRDFGVPSGLWSRCPESLWSSAWSDLPVNAQHYLLGIVTSLYWNNSTSECKSSRDRNYNRVVLYCKDDSQWSSECNRHKAWSDDSRSRLKATWPQWERVAVIAYSSIIHSQSGKIVEKKLRTQIF